MLYDVDGSNEKVIEPLNLTTSSQFGELSDLNIGYGMIVVGTVDNKEQKIHKVLVVEKYLFLIQKQLQV